MMNEQEWVRIPNTFNEGIAKGLILGGLIIASLKLTASTPKHMDILLGSYLGVTLLLGLVGWAREEHMHGAEDNFWIHPIRRIRQPTFWHNAYERVRPITRTEGMRKGFFLGLTGMILLNVFQLINPKYLSAVFLPILMGVLAGAGWGEYNQRHPDPQIRRLEA
jgi:hypothetical protein